MRRTRADVLCLETSGIHGVVCTRAYGHQWGQDEELTLWHRGSCKRDTAEKPCWHKWPTGRTPEENQTIRRRGGR